MNEKVYPGIDADQYGGMTDIGKIIRDAWVFGLLPEAESCAGWNYGRLERLYDQVHAAWSQYGFRVSGLPEEVRARHERIHAEAVRRASELGWNVELGEDD